MDLTGGALRALGALVHALDDGLFLAGLALGHLVASRSAAQCEGRCADAAMDRADAFLAAVALAHLAARLATRARVARPGGEADVDLTDLDRVVDLDAASDAGSGVLDGWCESDAPPSDSNPFEQDVDAVRAREATRCDRH